MGWEAAGVDGGIMPMPVPPLPLKAYHKYRFEGTCSFGKPWYVLSAGKDFRRKANHSRANVETPSALRPASTSPDCGSRRAAKSFPAERTYIQANRTDRQGRAVVVDPWAF